MITIKQGIAVYFPVRIRSIFSLRIRSLLPSALLPSVHISLDKIKPHVRDSRTPVHTTLCLHLADNMLQHFFFIFIQLQLLQNQMISFNGLLAAKRRGSFAVSA